MNKNTKLVNELIKKEERRQREYITLIASENFASTDSLKAAGSMLTNKYAEGYPGKRYYGGCEIIDEIETLAQDNLNKLFGCKYSNVQPHSGSQANFAVYNALLKPGDKILGMSLSSGGHLTHGAKFNVSGIEFESYTYDVNEETLEIDYDEIEELAMKVKPHLIICGASAYPREIDFKKFKAIANKCGALLHADIAHIAGPIAAGLHNTPVGQADVITSTTHKTLRGPRSGIIMTNDLEIYNKINKSIFPGTQGGPLPHIIAAKAIAFGEALDKSFVDYQKQVIANTKYMSDEFIKAGMKVTTGGTDNHLFLVDVMESVGVDGKVVQEALKQANIILNMNSIPFDKLSTFRPSGIRIGAPAITTLGITQDELKKLTTLLINVIKNTNDKDIIESAKKEVLIINKRLWSEEGKNYEN